MPDFQRNKFFTHELQDGRIVLITELGRFTALSKEEYAQFQRNELSQELFKRLETAHILVTEQNKANIAGDYRLRYSHVCEGVSLHIINPTMRCNHRCLYCYANSSQLGESGFDMDEKTAEKVVDFIWQSPSKNITMEFQGGEPLANFPLIESIVNYTKGKKGKRVHWRIVSNLSMMDETIAAFLKRNNVLDICTSLDGPKKVHDKNRVLAGGSSFDKTVHWINSLRQDFGFKQVGALCTVTKNTLPFSKEVIETYLGLNLPDLTFVPLRKAGFAKQNWEKIGYTAEQYLDFWKDAVNHCIALNREGKQIKEQISVLSLGKMNRFEPSYHTCYSKPCGAALMQCSYQPNGDIFSCDEAKSEPLFKIGDVSQSYKQVFTSPEALKLVSLSSSLGFICNECKFTGFCSLCPVLCYTSQGNFVPILSMDEECRLKKAQFTFLLEKLFGKDKPILEKWLEAACI